MRKRWSPGDGVPSNRPTREPYAVPTIPRCIETTTAHMPFYNDGLFQLPPIGEYTRCNNHKKFMSNHKPSILMQNSRGPLLGTNAQMLRPCDDDPVFDESSYVELEKWPFRPYEFLRPDLKIFKKVCRLARVNTSYCKQAVHKFSSDQ